MNKTLLVGLVVTGMMIFIGLFGPLLAPYGIDDQLKIEYIVDEDGKGMVIAPPVAPNAEYPLGTDKNGYDLLTKLLYGAKYTIFLAIGIAIARVVIGGWIGLMLGYYGKGEKKKKGQSFWSMLNGIPIFLIVWLILIGISINPNASPFMMSLLLAVVLLIIGVPSVATTVKEKTEVIREKQFVQASESLGAGGWKIIRSHLLPHLKESFLILIVQEIILILTLFGQLAIFHIFVGGTTMYPDPAEYYSRTNEWGGLIGQNRMNFYVNQWIFYVPLVAYVALILGFHLVSKGLEKRYGTMFSKHSRL
ncbi:ABC transporter permease [Paenibacillus paeoniae]|uniref:ABC transporter permease subunit n=1 Tax=Paenibacillus paeoniae TaxID=2292705 RepID=A0A371PKI0_9BACL|nr:ABC transporter permease subunit [Paenibacillus paeoniae]REK76701.1 ABC transporter permease subunit [Paenibacillus paeoniae]